MKSIRLQENLEQDLKGIGLKISQPKIKRLSLLSQSLAVSSNCHLSNLALGMPVDARRENLIQRLRRFLKGGELGWHSCYGQIVRHLFEKWQGQEVALVMDRTDIGNRLSILVLGVAYKKRLLPLTWRIRPFGGTSADIQKRLLAQVKPYLPKECRIHYYGDCEFRAVELQSYLRESQWHWQTGLKGDTYVTLSNGTECQLRTLIQKGERSYWQEVYITKDLFGPVNLIADWTSEQDFAHFWAVDLPATPSAWRRGRKRFWIEPTFRDWKSYGFDLESTKIADNHRLGVLILGMAVTTLWMIHIGSWLSYRGRDYLLDRTHYPDFSLFRRGRDYVIRSQTMGWNVPRPEGTRFTVFH